MHFVLQISETITVNEWKEESRTETVYVFCRSKSQAVNQFLKSNAITRPLLVYVIGQSDVYLMVPCGF